MTSTDFNVNNLNSFVLKFKVEALCTLFMFDFMLKTYIYIYTYMFISQFSIEEIEIMSYDLNQLLSIQFE